MDGVVVFVELNKLVINLYLDDLRYVKEFKKDLEIGLLNVEFYEIVMLYDGCEIYDECFGFVCGLYMNMLVMF